MQTYGELIMFKKILLSGFVLGAMFLYTSIALANESNFFRTNVLSLQLNDNYNNVATLPTTPCNCPKTDSTISSPCNCGKTPCDCSQPKACDKNPCNVQSPCKPCEKTTPCWTEGKTCDKHIKKLYKFFAQADCAVGLTPEQKAKAIEIRKSTVEKIVPIKREIAAKKGELIALKRTKMCQLEIDKQSKIIEKEIKDLKKELKNTYKTADKEYKKILNFQQKRAYKSFKKEWKNKMYKKGIDCQKSCPCDKTNCNCSTPCDCAKPCPCDKTNCDCKKPCEMKKPCQNQSQNECETKPCPIQ